MKIYYHFLKSSNAITDLERKMIKVSRIDNLNDIFELRPYLRIDKAKRKRLENVRKEIAQNYGMVCFSETWQEPLLWGHYADNNRGIALGFEIISKKYNLVEVQYPPERENDPFGDSLDIPTTEYIKELGYKKYANWSYEKEYRFFLKLKDCINIEGNYYLKMENELALREIILGPANPYKDRKKYKITSRYLLELTKFYNVDFIVSRAEFGGYRIVKCGFWTPRFIDLIDNI
jgi:hypothetical protein